MHKEQGYIFDLQSHDEWREVQKINSKKEESFSSEILDLCSATQIKSPTQFNNIISNNYLTDKAVFSRNELGEEQSQFKGGSRQQGHINGTPQDDLSLSRDQSKNRWLISQSKNMSIGNSQKSLINRHASAINTSENVGSGNKGLIVASKIATNNINVPMNPNLNTIMNLKKRIAYFINYHTLFGRKQNMERNPKIRKIINDKSDGELQNSSQFSFQRIMYYLQLSGLFKIKRLKQIASCEIPMITSQNTWVFVWQMYITFYNYLFMLLLSFILIFSATKDSSEIEQIIFTITFYQWILEIIIGLNTATFYKTTLFNTRTQVLRLYFKTKFIYDVFPVVLLLFQSDNSIFQQVLFRVPIFLKIINMSRELKNIEKQLFMILDNFFFIQLINLVINLFLVGHFIACLWYIVSLIDQNYLDSEDSWIKSSIGVDGVWWKLYLNAFYWSFTLMATGSNVANTTIEMCFTSVVMLFTTIIFGYMVNMIGIILSEINKLEENKLRDINIINKFMKRKHISKDLQRRVNLDLEYLYLRSMKQKSEDENSVLSKISPDICNHIKIEYNRTIVQKIKCLFDNFTEDTITQVCLELQEEFYSPNQIVFNEGEINDSSLMFLVSGQVDLFQEVKFLKTDTEKKVSSGVQMDYKIEKQSKFIFSLKKGTVFGELNFFSGLGRKLTAKSKQFSTILKLNRETFLNILQKNPQDFEKFCEMKDKIMLYSDFGSLKLGCSLCLSQFHFESTCPTSHFKKDNPFIFARYNYSVDQGRNEDFNQNRKRNKVIHSYKNRQLYLEKAQLIQQNYEFAQPENEEENGYLKTFIDDDDEDEEEQDHSYEQANYDQSIDKVDVLKINSVNQFDEDEDFPEQQIVQTVSKFSLLNGFTTADDKTKKSEIIRDKNNSMTIYNNELLNATPYEIISRNNLYDDTLSLNIPSTTVNNATNPVRSSRGTTMYQSSTDRTEFTTYLKENNNGQDGIKDSEFLQKERLKKLRKSKLSEETRKRFISIKTDYSKKKAGNSVLKKSSYFEREHQTDGEKPKTNEGLIKLQSLHGETQASHYEKLMVNSLWNFDCVRIYQSYFPQGNYINQINKFNQQRKKYLKKNNGNTDIQNNKNSPHKKKGNEQK